MKERASYHLFIICSMIELMVLFFPNSAHAGENRLDDSLANRNTDYVILNPNLSLVSQVTRTNTIYEIKDCFDLRGQSLTIPDGCGLSFNGGIIRNGILVGNNTTIESTRATVIISNVILDGTWNVEVAYPEWFGAVGDGVSDDRVAVQTAMNVSRTVVLNKDYLIHNAPFDYRRYNPIPEDELDYYQDVLAQKNRTKESQLTPLSLSSNKTVVVSGTLKAYSPLGILIELIGDNTVITGGGTISGCGIVNTVNVYSGKPSYPVTNWESALIYIKGSNNRIENLTIKNPTRQGISIDDYLSKGNVIYHNIIGGGVKVHTKDIEICNFTALFGIYARGTNTVVKENVFKKIDGRCLYDALYCNYTTTNVPTIDERTEVHTTFENNVVEDVLEHAVYTYASNLRIADNSIRADYTALQLFNGKQYVDNNTIVCNNGSSGIYVSGEEQVVTNNKLYNVGRYGIRCAGYYNGSCDYDYVANNYIEKVMAPFSNSQPKTTPAITFESSAFRHNKLHLNKITCENNTIVCIGESTSARTIPIVGIIAVYGDANSTIEQIHIINNTVSNSNVANNIGVTLMNENKNSVVVIEGNKCINEHPIISTTPGDPVLKIQGAKLAVISKNHLVQHGSTGTAFELISVDRASLSDNTINANLYSKSIFFLTNGDTSFDFNGKNIINGKATEQIVTIPANTTSPTVVSFILPDNHWDLEIVPINRAARKVEPENPLKVLKSDVNGVQLYHEMATSSPTQYRIRVKYK